MARPDAVFFASAGGAATSSGAGNAFGLSRTAGGGVMVAAGVAAAVGVGAADSCGLAVLPDPGSAGVLSHPARSISAARTHIEASAGALAVLRAGHREFMGRRA